MSGAEIALLKTLRNLKSDRILVILGEDGPLVQALRTEEIDVQVRPMDRSVLNVRRDKISFGRREIRQMGSSVKYGFRLRRTILEAAPDVVVSNSMKAHVACAISLTWIKIPYIAHVRDHVDYNTMSTYAVMLMRAIVGAAAWGTISNSKSTKMSIPDKARSVVIPSPITFPPAVSLYIAQASPLFVCVGRIAEWKGQHIAIEALRILRSRGVNGRLRIVGAALFGETDYEEKLKSLVQQYDLNNSVQFVGHVQDVYNQLEGAAGLVHCSTIPEPFGQVVVQGMAAGIPVIAANEGGPAETVTHGKDGLLYEPRNPVALADAMQEIIDDSGSARAMGEQARKTAESYTEKVVAKRYQNFLATMATPGGRRALSRRKA
ncbi:glycosyltransferase family 4 protein [Gordonia sp. NPDC003504]